MLHFIGQSHIGKVRDDNQDSFDYGELAPDCGFAVVCDGMGGAKGGSVASSVAVNTVSSIIRSEYREDMVDDEITSMLVKACEAANSEVYRRAGREPELQGMGTTAVIALISKGRAHILHVGDSRAYHIKKSAVTQITSDHSVVQQLVDRGEISAEDAKTHPQKNVITRAVGVDGYLSFDYDTVTLEKGAVLLLCTDGLTNMVSDKDIGKLVYESKDASKLIDAALEGGGNDNITAVIVY